MSILFYHASNGSKCQKPVEAHRGALKFSNPLGWEILSRRGFLSDFIRYLPSLYTAFEEDLACSWFINGLLTRKLKIPLLDKGSGTPILFAFQVTGICKIVLVMQTCDLLESNLHRNARRWRNEDPEPRVGGGISGQRPKKKKWPHQFWWWKWSLMCPKELRMVLLEFKMHLSRCSHCIGCCREQEQEGSGM